MASVEATATLDRHSLAGRGLHAGDGALMAVAGAAALVALVLVVLIAYRLVHGAAPSVERFGPGFLTHVGWDPVRNAYGAGSFLFGTALTALAALVLATPLALGIALYLTELAPRFLRGPVTALVELLAAIPSVVIGLWGILVLGPQLSQHVEPWLHSGFGWIPLFGAPSQSPASLFTAVVVLTIMVLPIVSSITRELFLAVPRELREGALALGMTRWEMVRGVVFPYARGGIAAAMILGLGRAVGEAIAVTQVVGGGVRVGWNVFDTGDTLASKIAASFQGATSDIQVASLFSLALILLVFSLVANLSAQWIVRRVARRQSSRAQR